MKYQKIIALLSQEISPLRAIYVFGSHASGEAGPNSDLDLAVLSDAPIEPLLLWSISAKLAEISHCEVDLLDFLAASRVMQSQILIKGERIYCDAVYIGEVDGYEAFVLNDKLDLDRRRELQLQDIKKSGAIYE